MGILNVTPDSFSEQGCYFDRKGAIAHGLAMEREGADILDIGGESTRPGSAPVAAEEELERTIPVVEALRRKGVRIPISIDTYKARVAERALRAGAEIVNDISGLRFDAGMAEVVRKYRAGVVLMHLRGRPSTMQQIPPVRQIVPAVRRGLSDSLRRALRAGIGKNHIVLDPGIGFGKTAAQNYEILNGLSHFAGLGCPILVGPSRKSFIRAATVRERWLSGGKRKLLLAGNQGIRPEPEELLFGTAAAVTAAILRGAHIIRVHDVRQMVAVVRIADAIISVAP